jgi:hypothetical protein
MVSRDGPAARTAAMPGRWGDRPPLSYQSWPMSRLLFKAPAEAPTIGAIRDDPSDRSSGSGWAPAGDILGVWRTTAWFPAILCTVTAARADRDGHPPYPVRCRGRTILRSRKTITCRRNRPDRLAGQGISTESVNIPSVAATRSLILQVISYQGIPTDISSRKGIFCEVVVLISRNSTKSTDFILDWFGQICHYHP